VGASSCLASSSTCFTKACPEKICNYSLLLLSSNVELLLLIAKEVLQYLLQIFETKGTFRWDAFLQFGQILSELQFMPPHSLPKGLLH
jgi:hypothetical protein